jgi:hypothetical protein
MAAPSTSESGHHRLLTRHLEAENAHRLAEALDRLSTDGVFEDVALQRHFPRP